MGTLFKSAGKRSIEIMAVLLVVLLFFAFMLSLLNRMFPSGTSIREIRGEQDSRRGASVTTPRNLLLSHGDEASDLLDLESPAAVLTSMRNTVKNKRAESIAWARAEEGMPLYDRDAVQTFQRSSAMIKLDKGDYLHMGDNSLVIIRRMEKDIIFKEKRSFVVVLNGELKGKFGGSEYVEVTTPNAVARINNQNKTGDQSEFRITVNPDKSSTFTVYQGSAEVTAQGKSVILKSSQMTSVDLNRSPSLPKSIPAPVTLISPGDNTPYYYRDLAPLLSFSWKKEGGSEGYHFIIARDPFFENVVYDERIPENRFSLGTLKNGTYFWRVNAIKDRGEGLVSMTRKIRIIQDREPPSLTLHSLPEIVYQDRFTLQGEAEPGASLFIKGTPVSISASGTFEYALPLQHGINMIVVEAVDKAGNVNYLSQRIQSKF